MLLKRRPSRRAFLKGLGPAGALVRVGLPPLEAMFNTHGTAYAADDVWRSELRLDPVAFRAMVQRQRHSREILDSQRDRA